MIDNQTRFVGRDLNFTINLSAKNELGGLSESLNDFIEHETGLSINPASDGERLKYLPLTNLTYTFNFYNTTGGTYGPSLINAGFSVSDITTVSQALRKSFYLFQIYDSTDSASQKLLHAGYYNGFTFFTGATSYTIKPTAEVSGYYVANDSGISGSTPVYLKLSFYNARTGKFKLFQNQAKLSNTTEAKFYFDVTLNTSAMTYTVASPLVAREFINTAYITALQKNVPVFSFEAPSYPEGSSLSGNTYFNP